MKNYPYLPMTIVDSLAPGQPATLQKLIFITRLTFLLTIVAIPFSLPIMLIKFSIPPIWSGYTDISLLVSDVFMLAMLALWGIKIWLVKQKVKAGKPYIWIPLVSLTAIGWLSIFVSVSPLISFYHAIRLGVLFLFYLYVVNEIQSLGWLIAGVAGQSLLQAGVAIAQYASQHSIGLSFLGEYDLDPQVLGTSVISYGATRYLRVYGLADHPNILGGCAALSLILLLAAYLYGSEKYRALSALILLPTGLTLFLTFSRSAWLALIAGVVFFVITANKRRDIFIKLIQVAMISLILFAPIIFANRGLFGVRLGLGISQDAPSTEKQSVSERILLFQSANEMFAKHMLLGIGLGASPVALKENFPDFPYNYQPPHFSLLAAALETGIFGALSYFLLSTIPLLIFLSQYKRHLANPQALTVVALLLSINIIGLFDYYPWLLVSGRIWQWLAWGLWSVVTEKSTNELA